MTAALEANEIDCLDQFFVSTSPQLLSGSFNIIKLRGSGHRELSMRCDLAPFKNNLVRQAMGLLLDRPALVKSLFKGYADIGNDNPFAPVFPSTAPVPQRSQNLAQAKKLLAQAGYPRGFSTPFLTEQRQEMPQLAQYIQQWAKQVGVDIKLTDRDTDQVLRLGRLRDFGLAGRRDEHVRLRGPLHAEPVPRGPAADATTPRPAPAPGTAPASPTRPTTSSPRSTSPRPTSPASGPSRSRSRLSSLPRPRSSTPTSTTTSLRPRRT